MGYGFKPENHLHQLAGCKLFFNANSKEWRVENDGEGRTSLSNVYVAGDANGVKGWESARIEGEITANSLLKDLSFISDNSEVKELKIKLNHLSLFYQVLEKSFPFPRHFINEIKLVLVEFEYNNRDVKTLTNSYKRLIRKLEK